MRHTTSKPLPLGIFALLLFTLVSPVLGGDIRPADTNTTSQDITTFSMSAPACLPMYGQPEFLLRVRATSPQYYEPFVHSADFNADGLEDVVITRLTFQTYHTYELDILLNDGDGGMRLATPNMFLGPVPTVQHPAQVVTSDFNGDGVTDIFVADHGNDTPPHPGFQNVLALSNPDGKFVDATHNLPQQNDMSHSACTADIDGDDDNDLYIGNTWGQNEFDPYLLLNDGNGKFTVGLNRLPPLVSLGENGYTTCEFSDVNKDGSPDLILGDAGDDISNEFSTPNSEVLLNNGSGVFTLLPGAMPGKNISTYDIAHDIVPLHLNQDAYIDLLIVYEGWEGSWSGWRGSYIQALVNNKDGTFRDESTWRIEPLDREVWIRRLHGRDLDGDGDLDLLAFPWDEQSDPLLFLNDGSGHFSRKRFGFGMPSLYYTFLDLDGDGGHDLLYDTFAPPEDIYVIRDLGCPVFLPVIGRNRPASD